MTVLVLRRSGCGFLTGLGFDGYVLPMFRIVVVLDHPFFIFGNWFGGHFVVAAQVGEVFDVGFEVAGEIRVGFSEDGKQNHELLPGFLPSSSVSVVAEGVLEFFRAVEGEVDAVGLSVFEDVGAAFAFGLFGITMVVESGFAAAEDVDAQRIVGGVSAFSLKNDGSKKAERQQFCNPIH